ncbi:hypothetical protein J8273_8033 [Carpediemonas membranifera]|uniref:Uncharacterized protein n=1 Tax=Carpediemonas membranifera TaxID=201153 RepID=A0A8J6E1I2_9EUKA|nr:hypothetical protein J8273_8033 [Carpediemonas membranifera]|eukprot:KAG9390667.1 hypothetical protein J8273_8033 [Carpediemonas membranifera]
MSDLSATSTSKHSTTQNFSPKSPLFLSREPLRKPSKKSGPSRRTEPSPRSRPYLVSWLRPRSCAPTPMPFSTPSSAPSQSQSPPRWMKTRPPSARSSPRSQTARRVSRTTPRKASPTRGLDKIIAKAFIAALRPVSLANRIQQKWDLSGARDIDSLFVHTRELILHAIDAREVLGSVIQDISITSSSTSSITSSSTGPKHSQNANTRSRRERRRPPPYACSCGGMHWKADCPHRGSTPGQPQATKGHPAAARDARPAPQPQRQPQAANKPAQPQPAPAAQKQQQQSSQQPQPRPRRETRWEHGAPGQIQADQLSSRSPRSRSRTQCL